MCLMVNVWSMATVGIRSVNFSVVLGSPLSPSLLLKPVSVFVWPPNCGDITEDRTSVIVEHQELFFRPFECYSFSNCKISTAKVYFLANQCSKGCLPNKKRKKIQTSVKKVGGGDPPTQNKNMKLILDKSIGREGAKSVCQNFKND